jgi:hypothetical protein
MHTVPETIAIMPARREPAENRLVAEDPSI